MLPIQEITIRTKNKRLFAVHLESWSQNHFECKLAAINLGPQLPADATFGPFVKGESALSAYTSLISTLTNSLKNLDTTDEIAEIDNPCNTEFISASEQKQIVGQNVLVKVNGSAA